MTMNPVSPLNPSLIEAFHRADKIVVGAGAGLSASAGLDYWDPALFRALYRPFLKTGSRNIGQEVNRNWYLTDENAEDFWGFWAWHIRAVCHGQNQLKAYGRLGELLKGRNYFIITTNTDGQFFKGRFDPQRIFEVRGSLGRMQCRRGCHPDTYDSREMTGRILQGFNEESLRIEEADIPRCPVCGRMMSPNLRMDRYFVEASRRESRNLYREFLDSPGERIVFLELGAGLTTSSLIREPFEQMTNLYKKAVLIRVNRKSSEFPAEIETKGFYVTGDITGFLEKIR